MVLIARPLTADGRELPLVGERVATDRPVWISEAVADLYGYGAGDTIGLPLAGELREFTVAGVWRDYARQSGAIMIPLERYRTLSGDRLANDAALHLLPGETPAAVAARLRERFGGEALELAQAGEIRAISLRIFDRTFAVTYLLEAVAVVIGLFGVAASFAALAAARRREFGMLRHIGLTRRQVGLMLATEGRSPPLPARSGAGRGRGDFPRAGGGGKPAELSLEHGFPRPFRDPRGLLRHAGAVGGAGRGACRPSGDASGGGDGGEGGLVMGRMWCWLLLVVTLPALAVDYPPVRPGRSVSLPADTGAHPGTEPNGGM